MTQDMTILENTMEYIYYIRHDDLEKLMNKLFHGNMNKSIIKKKLTDGITLFFRKLNYSYSIEL